MASSKSKPRRARKAKSPRHPKDIALGLLLKAAAAARARGRDRWEFALEFEFLLPTGLTPTDLRELLCDGLVESGIETTEPESGARRFRRLCNLTLTAKTCFVLTGHGEHVAIAGTSNHARFKKLKALAGEDSRPVSAGPRPRWDRTTRRLLFGEQVVKRFRVPAPCQEVILRVFEEAGWPSYIDDPLSPHNGENAGTRLHNTIKALNSHHLVSLLHFNGNGNGKGVHWELV